MLSTAVSAGPDEDGAEAGPTFGDSFDESSSGQLTGTVHRFTVVVRTLQGRENN